MRLSRLIGLAPALVLATVALAAEPVFPPGSRVGLVPPPGMTLSKRFTGFETPRGAAITLFEMPPAAAGALLSGVTAEGLKNQNIAMTGREELKIGGADAVLAAGDQEVSGIKLRKWIVVVPTPSLTAFAVAQDLPGPDAYDEEAMLAALKSIAIRPPLSMDEQLEALPFRLGDRAGFKPVRTGGGSLLLTERGEDGGLDTGQAVIVVAHAGERGPPNEQRDAFAVALLRSNPALRELVFERGQGFRQKGAEWHEIVARGKDAPSGKEIVVMQTIRWDRDGFVRMLAVAPATALDDMLPRFRTLADSISPG